MKDRKSLLPFDELASLYADCASVYGKLLHSGNFYAVPSLGVKRADELIRLSKKATGSLDRLMKSREYRDVCAAITRFRERLNAIEEELK